MRPPQIYQGFWKLPFLVFLDSVLGVLDKYLEESKNKKSELPSFTSSVAYQQLLKKPLIAENFSP